MVTSIEFSLLEKMGSRYDYSCTKCVQCNGEMTS